MPPAAASRRRVAAAGQPPIARAGCTAVPGFAARAIPGISLQIRDAASQSHLTNGNVAIDP
jgi:hypothetical protein